MLSWALRVVCEQCRAIPVNRFWTLSALCARLPSPLHHLFVMYGDQTHVLMGYEGRNYVWNSWSRTSAVEWCRVRTRCFKSRVRGRKSNKKIFLNDPKSLWFVWNKIMLSFLSSRTTFTLRSAVAIVAARLYCTESNVYSNYYFILYYN